MTTTSGLAWKIPGRVGDSPILGAGLYVDNDAGAAGSTGRGEANLYGLCSFVIVEEMRRGSHPKDAGMAALERIRDNTIESRLLNAPGLPNFNVTFYVVNKAGDYAGVALPSNGGEGRYSLCTENGAELLPTEPLLEATRTPDGRQASARRIASSPRRSRSRWQAMFMRKKPSPSAPNSDPP